MKKRYISAVLLVALFFVISANSYDAPQAQEGFKNLKILPKDISKDKLDSVMANYSVSLGVRCNFCHATAADSIPKKHLDFASDAKDEKNIARNMMNMTAYLNTNYFNFDHSSQTDTIHTVVCYTCHRGTHEPDAKAFLTLIDSTLKSYRKGR